MTRFASMLSVLAAAVPILLLAAASPAPAAQCNVTATPVSFGSYDTLSAVPLDSTGTISITCNPSPLNPQPVSVQLTAGNSGSFAQRSLNSASGASLLYNLFANAAMTEVFGDGSSGSTSLARTVDRADPWNITLFGRIPPGQNVRVGTYSDVITVTIEW